MNHEEFLTAFESCTLPREHWTHSAHVRLAWLYLTQLPFAAALDRIRDGIRRYNAAGGSDGYHETITVAFTRLVHARLAPDRAPEDFPAFQARNPELFAGRGDLLGQHYSSATLASTEAKQRFVEPDREPFQGIFR
jgi:hypothetical protein